MKLTKVLITGMRSLRHSEIPLGGVTLFTGPNGVGKTAAIGAIAYALTGRFPGVPATVNDLLSLANDREQGFRVELVADDNTVVERGIDVDGKPEAKFMVIHGGRRTKGKQAEVILREAFGEVAWFVDAFDPERSIWRMSGEKRKEWALNLCAGSSGWSMERLLGEIGKKSEDWDPELSPEPGTCLELNLDGVYDKLLGLNRLVREAKAIAEGVTVAEDLETIAERVVSAEAELERARRKIGELETSLRSTSEQQTATEVARRERKRLEKAAADARVELTKILPPEPPQRSFAPQPSADAELVTLQLEAEATQEEWAKACAEEEAAKQALAVLETLRATGKCDFCGAESPNAARMAERLTDAVERVAAAERKVAATYQRYDVAQDKEVGLRFAIENQAAAEKVYQQEIASFEDRKNAFDSTWQTLLRNVQSIEEQIAKLPADRADVVISTRLEEDLVSWRAEHARCKATLDGLRAELGVAQERAGQLKAAEAATERIEVLKTLQGRMKAVRDRMLDDATQPLSTRLGGLSALAPRGGRWGILRQERTVDVALWTKGGSPPLPVTSLSAGERMRGTIALLVARSLVRREPWTGIFVDNFEQIYPAEERVSVLRALVAAERAGAVDNVFVAAACEPIVDEEGLGLTGLITYDILKKETS